MESESIFKLKGGQNLLSRLSEYYRKGYISYCRERLFVFVCGGPKNKNTFRRKFLEYSSSEQNSFFIFNVEDAFEKLKDGDDIVNIAKFEKLVASISDCIIIFPESPGSFAEVGYFSAHKEIRKNTLVVNSYKHQNRSFLNLGPIEIISRKSRFRTPIILKDCEEKIDFSNVKERIRESIFISDRNKKIKGTLKEMKPKDRIFAILSVVSVLAPIKYDDLFCILTQVFGQFSYKIIKQYLAIISDETFFRKNEMENKILRLSNNMDNLIKLENNASHFCFSARAYYHKQKYLSEFLN